MREKIHGERGEREKKRGGGLGGGFKDGFFGLFGQRRGLKLRLRLRQGELGDLLFGDGSFKHQKLDKGSEIFACDVVIVFVQKRTQCSRHIAGALEAILFRSFEGFQRDGFQLNRIMRANGRGAFDRFVTDRHRNGGDIFAHKEAFKRRDFKK